MGDKNMRRKDGDVRSDYDKELDYIILDIIDETKMVSIDGIRNIINKRHRRKLGWGTIKRHIDLLEELKKISIAYENKGGDKKIRLYKIRKR